MKTLLVENVFIIIGGSRINNSEVINKYEVGEGSQGNSI